MAMQSIPENFDDLPDSAEIPARKLAALLDVAEVTIWRMPKSPDLPNATAPKGRGSGLVALPAPRMNLTHLDGVRREMARVYRDMRGARVHSQDGARLVYVLGELRKMFEVCELEKRIDALEGRKDGNT
jgi:hypothetical protein